MYLKMTKCIIQLNLVSTNTVIPNFLLVSTNTKRLAGTHTKAVQKVLIVRTRILRISGFYVHILAPIVRKFAVLSPIQVFCLSLKIHI